MTRITLDHDRNERKAGHHTVQRTVDALASPIRREILWLVWGRELAAGEIAVNFEVTAPTVSSHLTTLREAGLVTMRVDGNFRRYQADPAAVECVRGLLATEDERWQVADDIPEHETAVSATMRLVEIEVTVAIGRAEAFRAFVDADIYSAFMGVPVHIRDGQFRCELEWGTQVRGQYDVVAPPDLIALRWDFADDQIPVPGGELTAYMRFHDGADGTRVVVHQHARDDHEAEFMQIAWGLVLGRFAEYVAGTARSPRQRRSKRSDHRSAR